MNRIKVLRLEKDMSQAKLAETFDISQQAVSHYEKGIRDMDYALIKSMANFFNVSIDYLLGNSSIKESADEVLSTHKELSNKQTKDKKVDTIAAHLEGKDISPKKMKLMLNYIDALFDEFDD